MYVSNFHKAENSSCPKGCAKYYKKNTFCNDPMQNQNQDKGGSRAVADDLKILHGLSYFVL